MSKLLQDMISNNNVKRDAIVVSMEVLPLFVPHWEGDSNGIRVYIYKLCGRDSKAKG